MSNGTVYIRNGSSKEPIKSERATIEFLFNKAHGFHEKVSNFCHREIYYPWTRKISSQEIYDYIICNIYFKNLFDFGVPKLRTQHDMNELWKYIKTTNSDLFEQMQRGQESIILWHSLLDPLTEDSTTMVLEIFFDLSVKIHIPIDHPSTKNTVSSSEAGEIQLNQRSRIFDGLTSYNCVRSSLLAVCKLMQRYGQHLDHYAFCLELENCENAVLNFSGDLYQNEVNESGLYFACKPIIKSKFVNFVDSNLTWEQIPKWVAENYFLSSFGRPVNSSTEILIDATKADYPDL